jgi:hypothetical protein
VGLGIVGNASDSCARGVSLHNPALIVLDRVTGGKGFILMAELG